jgi:alkanesulfonate monooxygenase SsuD/methylene tetrahydromethanopterin reductase-like flavin-dependent oxidoreductase (luciferase family)
MPRQPHLSLISTPRKRLAIVELAKEAERRGFPGIASPSLGTALGLCASLAHETSTIRFFTAIQPIYHSVAAEAGAMAAYLDEVSGGRFALGLGVSHEVMNRRLGVQPGKPLADTSDYVATMRATERYSGALPPIYLAAMRDRMLALAAEIAEGAIWANSCRSAAAAQLARVPAAARDGFFRGNMVPTVIDDDRAAADAVNRKTMTTYLTLPHYRNYWKQAGYVEEMEAIETALARGERDALPGLMSDTWLHDCTLSGSVAQVREGLEAWADTGIVPIAVMSSTSGGQAKAVQELFDAYG